MTGNQDRNDRPARPNEADPHADRGIERNGGAVPRTTEENEKAAEGERVEPSPNPGHPV